MSRYFENFTVGDAYNHWLGRNITAAGKSRFTLLTMKQHPVHVGEK